MATATPVPPPSRRRINEPAPAPVAVIPPARYDVNESLGKMLHQLDLLNGSAVGVIMIRTSEPHRVEKGLKEWAFEKNTDYHDWDALVGWSKHPDREELAKDANASAKVVFGKPAGPGAGGGAPAGPPVSGLDPVNALKWIGDIDGNGKAAKDGLFLFKWSHFYVASGKQPHPHLLTILLRYSQQFTTIPLASDAGAKRPPRATRLVLMVPEGISLPNEIEHVIPLIDLDLPSKSELRKVYDGLAVRTINRGGDSVEVALNFAPDEQQRVIDMCSGLTEAEAELAISKAIVEHKALFPNIPFKDFQKMVAETKVEIIRQSEVLELMTAEETMADVGGLDALKRWIARGKISLTDRGRAMKLDPMKGVVALGPPGCGKSLIAKAVAAELNLPLIKFDIGRVFGSLVGQSEQRVRSALKLLATIAPAVVWLDEVDKSGMNANQGGGDGGVSKRVFGALLEFMQETKAPLFWVATGNWPHLVDPAFTRKGRFDQIFAVLPPNRTERRAVLEIHLRKRGHNLDEIHDLEVAVEASDGFVSAELEAAVKEARIASCWSGIPVSGQMIADELGKFKKMKIAYAAEMQQMEDWARTNATNASDDDAPRVATGLPVPQGRSLSLA